MAEHQNPQFSRRDVLGTLAAGFAAISLPGLGKAAEPAQDEGVQLTSLRANNLVLAERIRQNVLDIYSHVEADRGSFDDKIAAMGSGFLSYVEARLTNDSFTFSTFNNTSSQNKYFSENPELAALSVYDFELIRNFTARWNPNSGLQRYIGLNDSFYGNPDRFDENQKSLLEAERAKIQTLKEDLSTTQLPDNIAGKRELIEFLDQRIDFQLNGVSVNVYQRSILRSVAANCLKERSEILEWPPTLQRELVSLVRPYIEEGLVAKNVRALAEFADFAPLVIRAQHACRQLEFIGSLIFQSADRMLSENGVSEALSSLPDLTKAALTMDQFLRYRLINNGIGNLNLESFNTCAYAYSYFARLAIEAIEFSSESFVKDRASRLAPSIMEELLALPDARALRIYSDLFYEGTACKDCVYEFRTLCLLYTQKPELFEQGDPNFKFNALTNAQKQWSVSELIAEQRGANRISIISADLPQPKSVLGQTLVASK